MFNLNVGLHFNSQKCNDDVKNSNAAKGGVLRVVDKVECLKLNNTKYLLVSKHLFVQADKVWMHKLGILVLFMALKVHSALFPIWLHLKCY